MQSAADHPSLFFRSATGTRQWQFLCAALPLLNDHVSPFPPIDVDSHSLSLSFSLFSLYLQPNCIIFSHFQSLSRRHIKINLRRYYLMYLHHHYIPLFSTFQDQYKLIRTFASFSFRLLVAARYKRISDISSTLACPAKILPRWLLV